ncbi:hypothetical protein [Streptomyces sp. NPDC055005]
MLSHTGRHVSTGRADNEDAAVRAAHEADDMARAPRPRPQRRFPTGGRGWGACGHRPGWELDWPAAKAGPWKSPYSWTNFSAFEL